MIERLRIEGQRFGRWAVLSFAGIRNGHSYFCVKCDCGSNKTILGRSLKNGESKSCGCLRRELSAVRLRRHGLYGTPSHVSWVAMLSRCRNPHNCKFPLYGGRGIRVCARWRRSFLEFYKDMGPRPKGTTLDRRHSDGNYTKRNCRWATALQQAQNKRSK
jgi:hypothetical protein